MSIRDKKSVRITGIIFAFIIFSCSSIQLTKAADESIELSDTAYDATMEYGRMYDICPELLQAIIETESSANPNATNGGCKGLCQIYEKYHYERMRRLEVWNLYNERDNILIAADYLAELFEEYGEVGLVLDIYNGNSNARRYYETGVTSKYTNKILKRTSELERLHGK